MKELAVSGTPIDESTRLIDITVGDLKELISSLVDAKVNERVNEGEHHHVYGLAGIASIFNCSHTTAGRIKNSGKIDKAITQHGRTIFVDVEKALQLFNKDNN